MFKMPSTPSAWPPPASHQRERRGASVLPVNLLYTFIAARNMETQTVTSSSVPVAPNRNVLLLLQSRPASAATTQSLVNFKTWLIEKFPAVCQRLLDRGVPLADPSELASEEDAEKYNAQLAAMWDEAMQPMKKSFMEAAKVNPGDSREQVEFKLAVAQGAMSWLRDVSNWLIDKLKELFVQIKNGIKWVMAQAQSLFQTLYDYLSGITSG
eukprot:TRINITY_DN4318_c0_g1_i1.p1 TRINITY_DN4318_c0_g1~~TRINITY_DN4318_c0_g1_i1.p1  ORF type:complete len:211 (+),score=37.36 TRINITY_DN4318_c0_g1_i1:423-1055(+)